MLERFFQSLPVLKYIRLCLSVVTNRARLYRFCNPPEITHLNTLNMAFLTVSVFGHLEFACTGGGVHQNLDMEFLRT